MKICFATHNENKLQEIKEILPGDFELIGLAELGLNEEIPETGETLEENSMQKATFIFDRFKIPIFADDTGLEVLALDGQPGVYSARYAGSQRNAEDNMSLLLKNLKESNDRSACFKTVITYINVEGNSKQFVGQASGVMTKEKRGTGGFGYDPIFEPTGFNQTFGEMDSEQKNQISHRARAFKKLVNYLATP